jgi:hypothetical protein
MTQVVPEHVARAKLGSGGSNSSSGGNTNNTIRKDNNSTSKTRIQRSNSATLSTISVTCDTDTSIRSRNTRYQQSPSKKTLITNINKIPTSRSSSGLMNVSVNPPPTSFRNYHQYKSSGNSSSSMSTSLTTASGMNIIHEKSTLSSSASTISMPNKHLIKNTGGGGAGSGAGAVGGTTISTKSLSNKHKAMSFDDHHRANQNRRIGKSVLEHLVFVFPENVRRMLAGPKK